MIILKLISLISLYDQFLIKMQLGSIQANEKNLFLEASWLYKYAWYRTVSYSAAAKLALRKVVKDNAQPGIEIISALIPSKRSTM